MTLRWQELSSSTWVMLSQVCPWEGSSPAGGVSRVPRPFRARGCPVSGWQGLGVVSWGVLRKEALDARCLFGL